MDLEYIYPERPTNIVNSLLKKTQNSTLRLTVIEQMKIVVHEHRNFLM